MLRRRWTRRRPDGHPSLLTARSGRGRLAAVGECGDQKLRAALVAGLAAAALALAAAPGAQAAGPIGPIGDQFRISFTGSDGDAARSATAPAAAYNPVDGLHLVVWTGNALNVGGFEVFGQMVTADGKDVGGQIRISNATDINLQHDAGPAAVAYDPQTDEFVVVWQGEEQPANGELEIWGQRLSGTGHELGSDFRISNTGMDGDVGPEARNPAIAFAAASGQYLVAWEGEGLPSGETEIFGQRLSPAGGELGEDFRISHVGADGDVGRVAHAPDVAYDSHTGELLVVWDGDGLDTDDEFEVFGQRLAATGDELGDDFRISHVGSDGDAARAGVQPAVAYSTKAGQYLVTYAADGLATPGEGEIFGQRLTASGAALGPALRVSTTGADGDPARDAELPAVSYGAFGDEYLVAWQADGLSTDNEVEIFGQRVAATGAELGQDFRISHMDDDGDATRGAERAVTAYNSGDNQYLVAWDGDGLAADNELEVFGRRSGAGVPPDKSITLVLTARRRQKLLRSGVSVRERCTGEVCSTVSRARTRNLRGLAAKKFRSRKVTRSLRAGVTTTVKLKFKARDLRRLRRALRKGRKVVVTVSVTATDSAGNSATRSIQVRLRR